MRPYTKKVLKDTLVYLVIVIGGTALAINYYPPEYNEHSSALAGWLVIIGSYLLVVIPIFIASYIALKIIFKR